MSGRIVNSKRKSTPSIRERNVQNGKRVKRVKISACKLGGRKKITDKIKEERMTNKDNFLGLCVAQNGFTTAKQLTAAHLMTILANLGCPESARTKNMINKTFKKGSKSIVPSLSLDSCFTKAKDNIEKLKLSIPEQANPALVAIKEVTSCISTQTGTQKVLNFKPGKELPIPWVLTSYMTFRCGTLPANRSKEELRELIMAELDYLSSFEQKLVPGDVLFQLKSEDEVSRLLGKVLELLPDVDSDTNKNEQPQAVVIESSTSDCETSSQLSSDSDSEVEDETIGDTPESEN